MKLRHFPLLLLSLAGDLFACVVLFRSRGIGADVLVFGLSHLVASLVATIALVLLWPGGKKERRPRIAYLVFPLCLFMPGLGLLGLSTAVLITLWVPLRQKRPDPWSLTEIPDLPAQPFRVSAQPIYLAVGLTGVLRHAQDPGVRQRAVMATRQMTDQNAIHVLTVALKDPADDVRLLAYAMLDGKERSIYGRIKATSKRLDEARTSDEKIRMYQHLAYDYWELAYLGLAQGEVLAHVLKEARRNIEAVLAVNANDPGSHFLRGRILLRGGDTQGARACFEHARELGLPAQVTLAYMAEVHYLLREFGPMCEQLRAMGSDARQRLPWPMITRHWLGEKG